MQTVTLIKKEFALIRQDKHSLLLLFLMPAAFVLIMSLAMEGLYSQHSETAVAVLVFDQRAQGASVQLPAQELLAQVAQSGNFKLQLQLDTELAATRPLNLDQARQAVEKDEVRFLLVLQDNSFDSENLHAALLLASPTADRMLTQLLTAEVSRALAQSQLAEVGAEQNIAVEYLFENLIDVSYLGQRPGSSLPSAVQQNVPAWLVFGMFFIAIPVSNTLIRERDSGTLQRVFSMQVARWRIIAGKLIPYFVLNQAQVLVMLAVGVLLVPLLGGQGLQLGQSVSGLLFIAFACSLAALGLALLIASFARTTEQATTLGGAGNIILAALGGIMVPVFVMPMWMQKLSLISPMSWGLQGFLDILVRSGSWRDVLPECLALSAFGVVAILLALPGIRPQH